MEHYYWRLPNAFHLYIIKLFKRWVSIIIPILQIGKLRCRRVKWFALVIQVVSGRAGDRHPAFLPVPVLPTGPHCLPRWWDLCYQNMRYISKPKREVLTNVHGTIEASVYWFELFSLQLSMETFLFFKILSLLLGNSTFIYKYKT